MPLTKKSPTALPGAGVALPRLTNTKAVVARVLPSRPGFPYIKSGVALLVARPVALNVIVAIRPIFGSLGVPTLANTATRRPVPRTRPRLKSVPP